MLILGRVETAAQRSWMGGVALESHIGRWRKEKLVIARAGQPLTSKSAPMLLS